MICTWNMRFSWESVVWQSYNKRESGRLLHLGHCVCVSGAVVVKCRGLSKFLSLTDMNVGCIITCGHEFYGKVKCTFAQHWPTVFGLNQTHDAFCEIFVHWPTRIDRGCALTPWHFCDRPLLPRRYVCVTKSQMCLKFLMFYLSTYCCSDVDI